MHNDCTKLGQQRSLLRQLKLLIVPRFLKILYENVATHCVIILRFTADIYNKPILKYQILLHFKTFINDQVCKWQM